MPPKIVSTVSVRPPAPLPSSVDTTAPAVNVLLSSHRTQYECLLQDSHIDLNADILKLIISFVPCVWNGFTRVPCHRHVIYEGGDGVTDAVTVCGGKRDQFKMVRFQHKLTSGSGSHVFTCRIDHAVKPALHQFGIVPDSVPEEVYCGLREEELDTNLNTIVEYGGSLNHRMIMSLDGFLCPEKQLWLPGRWSDGKVVSMHIDMGEPNQPNVASSPLHTVKWYVDGVMVGNPNPQNKGEVGGVFTFKGDVYPCVALSSVGAQITVLESW